jgi:hypothetical protein
MTPPPASVDMNAIYYLFEAEKILLLPNDNWCVARWISTDLFLWDVLDDKSTFLFRSRKSDGSTMASLFHLVFSEHWCYTRYIPSSENKNESIVEGEKRCIHATNVLWFDLKISFVPRAIFRKQFSNSCSVFAWQY